MNITRHTFEQLIDPTGILSGDRYEFFLHIEVPEDDDLYTGNGIYVRVIFVIDEKGPRIAQYSIHENITNTPFDFELEEDEEKLIGDYCLHQINMSAL